MNPMFAGIGANAFETLWWLARDHRAVNLGQGHPDDSRPREEIRRMAAEATRALGRR